VGAAAATSEQCMIWLPHDHLHETRLIYYVLKNCLQTARELKDEVVGSALRQTGAFPPEYISEAFEKAKNLNFTKIISNMFP
jgi:hypothetical protein